MGYIFLAIAIVCELIGTTGLKYADGFSKTGPTLVTLASYSICFYFLSKALQHLNLGLVYTTWSGLGVVAATVISVFIFKEQINYIGVIGVALVVAGLTLLNFYGSTH